MEGIYEMFYQSPEYAKTQELALRPNGIVGGWARYLARSPAVRTFSSVYIKNKSLRAKLEHVVNETSEPRHDCGKLKH